MRAASTVVRDFRWTDVPAAVQIERTSFLVDRWSAESFWGELAGVPDRTLYLALDVVAESTTASERIASSERAAQSEHVTHNDSVAVRELGGYAGVSFIDSDAHLQTIAVAAPWRGHGLGALLLDAVLQRAAQRQCSRCLLEVAADNAHAIELYRGAGFDDLSVRERYYPGGGDALVLARGIQSAAANLSAGARSGISASAAATDAGDDSMGGSHGTAR